MRAFLAIPIPFLERSVLETQIRALADSAPDLSWVRPEGLHITLLFFGDISLEHLSEMGNRFSGFSFPAFRVRYEGIGQFPHRGRPRVLYAPIREGEKECEELYTKVCSVLSGLFVPESRPFTAHITLARVKEWQNAEFDRTIPISGEFPVDRMVFFESILHSRAPEYREIISVPFYSGAL
ncbi:MAG TPA: RNA 2',3'-cyclic phosphodiesterase [Spirochaetia bacterium]|jgi:2'-5' RNA ligase|nr:RNA 2',3'-cyclic phosphodiesterase [Spirochaetia bacterium]